MVKNNNYVQNKKHKPAQKNGSTCLKYNSKGIWKLVLKEWEWIPAPPSKEHTASILAIADQEHTVIAIKLDGV